jgi:hypothetical protein
LREGDHGIAREVREIGAAIRFCRYRCFHYVLIGPDR